MFHYGPYYMGLRDENSFSHKPTSAIPHASNVTLVKQNRKDKLKI